MLLQHPPPNTRSGADPHEDETEGGHAATSPASRASRPVRGAATRAISTYQKLVQAHPDHAEGWLNLGVLYEEMKRPDDAILAYENASRAAPSFPSPMLYKADLLWARGDRLLAAAGYKRYLQLIPAGEGADRARTRSTP